MASIKLRGSEAWEVESLIKTFISDPSTPKRWIPGLKSFKEKLRKVTGLPSESTPTRNYTITLAEAEAMVGILSRLRSATGEGGEPVDPRRADLLRRFREVNKMPHIGGHVESEFPTPTEQEQSSPVHSEAKRPDHWIPLETYNPYTRKWQVGKEEVRPVTANTELNGAIETLGTLFQMTTSLPNVISFDTSRVLRVPTKKEFSSYFWAGISVMTLGERLGILHIHVNRRGRPQWVAIDRKAFEIRRGGD